MPEILRITAKAQHGVRRCGMRHLAVPTDHPVDAFEPEQIAVLEKDPDLTVEHLDVPAETKSTGDRSETIKAAIQQLDPNNPEHFTKGNVPKVEAIEAVAGFELTAGERDAAWAEMTGAE